MRASKGLFAVFRSFYTTEVLSSFMLLFAASAALFLANSKWHSVYDSIIHYTVSFRLGGVSLLHTSLQHIINDGFMSLFFFVVGMEVKREFVEGELNSPKKASFPLLAAIGGSLVPALIFYSFNLDLPTQKGWGIVMATDIAFALGAITLLSHKVPFTLKVFLLSIAIIDDIIAVGVIALFYSQSISGPFLALVFIASLAIFLYFKLHLNSSIILSALAVILWFGMYKSGLHATLSGVILGFLIPNKNRWTQKQALDAASKTLSKKQGTSVKDLKTLKTITLDTASPLQRLISFHQPYINYLIMPAFAFANAGISIDNVQLNQWIQTPVSYGILIGLCLGKPIGIVLFSFLACKGKLSEKPQNVLWSQIIALGFLAGIGFTMSLFIMNLCFTASSPAYSYAKLSILVASAASAILGLFLLSLGPTIPLSQRKK